MVDETGTETTRSDAPRADESLFGDAADDTASAVVEEEESQAAPPEELKVVVSIKGGRATIGVQRPSADPHIESFDDKDLCGLTQKVLAVTERAKARWENEPKYPAHERPAPPARRRNRSQRGAAQASTAEGGTDEQQPETLRLF